MSWSEPVKNYFRFLSDRSKRTALSLEAGNVRWSPLDRPSRGLTMADSRERGMAGWTVPAPQRVVFCNNCGTLMEEPTFANTNVLCRMCGTVTPSKGAALAATSRACARLTPSASAQCLRSSW